MEDVRFIERGYQDFVGKLRRLGADIRVVTEPDDTRRPGVESAG